MSTGTSATGTHQDELRERAQGLFPGGVNSPVRAFRSVGAAPLLIERGEGPYVWDADGNRYIDLIGGWGPHILGHGNKSVVDAVRSATEHGFAFGATHPLEIGLGERIREAMPSLERLRFTSSGTEAVMSALRVARAATNRELVVKYAGAYHGHSDALLAEAGSGVATLAIPGSAGVPDSVAATTIVLQFNDFESISSVFAKRGDAIAAVIVEPVIANAGVIAPAPGYLRHLRDLTTRAGALLVFDEVITGFRVARGGAQEMFGIEPDLTTLGKIVGGGMPIGAYGGRRDLMDLVAPVGPVYQAGTLSGHPLAMAAGIATLDQLTSDSYVTLGERAGRLARGIEGATSSSERQLSVALASTLLTPFFLSRTPSNAAEALTADRDAYARFFRGMLRRGVLLPPSQFEAWFPALAHSNEDIDAVVAAAHEALEEKE